MLGGKTTLEDLGSSLHYASNWLCDQGSAIQTLGHLICKCEDGLKRSKGSPSSLRDGYLVSILQCL